MIGGLVGALADSGVELDAEAIADALWLARARRATAEDEPNAVPPSAARPLDPGPPDREARPDTSRRAPGPPRPPGRAIADARPATTAELAGSAGGSTVHLRRAPALPGQLELGRALRPLKQRRRSKRRLVLDTEATVRYFCDTGLLHPIMRPGVERWFDVDVVVDTGPSMAVWEDTGVELAAMLDRHGAFGTVRRWALHVDDGDIRLVGDSGLRHAPRQLIDPDARRLILVLTDCVGLHWYQEPVWDALRSWGRFTPVAVISTLPARLWPRTALGAVEVTLRSFRPGSANRSLDVELPWWWAGGDGGEDPIPVPVLTLEREPTEAWARMVMGAGGIAASGVVAEVPDWRPEPTPADLTPEERVRRFQVTVSPTAFRLAVYLAAVLRGRWRLPLARVVQRAMLPDSGQVHLAEVVVGGLVRVADSPIGDEAADFEFVPGIADLLRRSLGGTDAIRVFQALSEHVERETGTRSGIAALLLSGTSPSELPSHLPETAGAIEGLVADLGLGGIGGRPIEEPEVGGRRSPPRQTPRQAAMVANRAWLLDTLARRGFEPYRPGSDSYYHPEVPDARYHLAKTIVRVEERNTGDRGRTWQLVGSYPLDDRDLLEEALDHVLLRPPTTDDGPGDGGPDPGIITDRRALVVGLDQTLSAKGQRSRTAVADADHLADALGARAYVVSQLTGFQATEDGLREAIDDVFDGAGPETLVWIHVSVPLVVETGRRLRLMPFDADDPQSSGIPLDDIQARFEFSDAGAMLLTIETEWIEPTGGGSGSISPAAPSALPGRGDGVVLMSQTWGGVWEDRGPLALNLVRWLSRPEGGSLDDLIEAVEPAMRRWAANNDYEDNLRWWSWGERTPIVAPPIEAAGNVEPFTGFEVELLAVENGSCILVHWSSGDDRHLLIFDGGPDGSFRARLGPRLEELLSGDQQLILDLIVVSHVESSVLPGIVDLLEVIDGGSDPFGRLAVGQIMVNQLEALGMDRKPTQLREQEVLYLASRLGIPVNAAFERGPVGLEGEPTVFELADGLRVTVIGPLLPIRGDRDRGPVNPTSIVLLVEWAGYLVLLTGDAPGDNVVEGLRAAGLLEDSTRVDVLQLPHYADTRSCTPELLGRVVADHYLVGSMDLLRLPDTETFERLLDLRQSPFTVHLAAPPDRPDAEPRLAEVLEEAERLDRIRLAWPSGDANSTTVALIGSGG